MTGVEICARLLFSGFLGFLVFGLLAAFTERFEQIHCTFLIASLISAIAAMMGVLGLTVLIWFY